MEVLYYIRPYFVRIFRSIGLKNRLYIQQVPPMQIPEPVITAHIMSGWWFGTCFIFPYVGNVITPIDELIFFRGVCSTTKQIRFNRLFHSHIVYHILIYSVSYINWLITAMTGSSRYCQCCSYHICFLQDHLASHLDDFRPSRSSTAPDAEAGH